MSSPIERAKRRAEGDAARAQTARPRRSSWGGRPGPPRARTRRRRVGAADGCRGRRGPGEIPGPRVQTCRRALGGGHEGLLLLLLFFLLLLLLLPLLLLPLLLLLLLVMPNSSSCSF
ncbi:unnamed protein product [Prorocentrum cordatum]|uniref:Uncharacterized protein n=1 Tax=Prorocentrum cordatum TaxID=2364126 RepID=A0ABN9VVX6_9DINO|nr:unnamed protein product [Polarella glacialis]